MFYLLYGIYFIVLMPDGAYLGQEHSTFNHIGVGVL
jgi:hypothetical protein